MATRPHRAHSPQQRPATREETLDQAIQTRDRAIRDAQRRYQEQRRSILNDGDKSDKLTKTQKQQLEQILRTRNTAIRAAQEQFRLTQRRLNNR
jgi:hypothetical protein